VGSYTYQLNTRDVYGFAMKATYVEIGDKCLPIFKDPKTDSGTKKSARGLLIVTKDDLGYNLIDRVDGATEEIGAIAGPAKKSGKKKVKVGISGTALASAELLSDYLDTRVSIEQGKGKGKITIEFSGNEDLQRIVDLIEG
jgi:hypothetical protein